MADKPTETGSVEDEGAGRTAPAAGRTTQKETRFGRYAFDASGMAVPYTTDQLLSL